MRNHRPSGPVGDRRSARRALRPVGERKPVSSDLPKVLCIVGEGRSGSTILDQILGQIDGWFSCGEFWYVWHNGHCGCGRSVNECEVWRPIVTEVLESEGWSDATPVIRLQDQEFGTSPAKLLAIHRERSRRRKAGARAMRYPEILMSLYAAVCRTTGANVLVDSSKIVTRAYMLAMLTEIDLYVVHLVRDPRGVAYSRGKRKIKVPDPPLYFPRFGPVKSSLNWLRRNIVIEAFLRRCLGDRYLRLRYEDLAAEPQAAVRSVCALVGEPDAGLPFIERRTVRLSPNHTVGGNPSRFSSGKIDIRPDDEWMVRASRRTRVLATLITAPLMPLYGYRLRSGSQPSARSQREA